MHWWVWTPEPLHWRLWDAERGTNDSWAGANLERGEVSGAQQGRRREQAGPMPHTTDDGSVPHRRRFPPPAPRMRD